MSRRREGTTNHHNRAWALRGSSDLAIYFPGLDDLRAGVLSQERAYGETSEGTRATSSDEGDVGLTLAKSDD